MEGPYHIAAAEKLDAQEKCKDQLGVKPDEGPKGPEESEESEESKAPNPEKEEKVDGVTNTD